MFCGAVFRALHHQFNTCRYESSLRAQVEYFARIVVGEKVMHYTKEQSISTAQLVTLAEQSAKEGRKLAVAKSPMTLLQIGNGLFSYG